MTALLPNRFEVQAVKLHRAVLLKDRTENRGACRFLVPHRHSSITGTRNVSVGVSSQVRSSQRTYLGFNYCVNSTINFSLSEQRPNCSIALRHGKRGEPEDG